MFSKSIEKAFLISAMTLDSPFMSTNEFLEWLERKKTKIQHSIEIIKFSNLVGWGFDERSSNLVHDSGKFFSIEGVEIKTNWGEIPEWSQPIINQPEIGFLGIITKNFNGILCFLMQAKIEPGNINGIQVSPTLQATKSNYTLVHKGNPPNYLEYFSEQRDDVRVLLDQLQSEQGARFLKKRNRNIIIQVSSEIEVKEEYCWLTLGQIKELLTYNNIVNMDTRTVISGISYGDTSVLTQVPAYNNLDEYSLAVLKSETDTSYAQNSIKEIISWLTRLKSFAELEVERIPLNTIQDWNIDESSIYHKDHKYFSIIAVRAEIGNREVSSWTQPLVKSAQEGIIAFIIKKIGDVYHFLVQAKLEAGNFDIIELAPTVQCLTGNYRQGESIYEVKFLDHVLQPEKYGAKVRYSTFQSEEGGRFYKEQNLNLIVEVGDDFDIQIPEKYMWMTLNQIKTFITFNNYLNIQARSLLSAIKFI